MEVAGLTTSTPRGPLTPGKGLSVEEAGRVPDRVLTASGLDTLAPWGLVQQTLRGGLWVPEMLLGIPQAAAETHVSRLHRATVSWGVAGEGGRAQDRVERSRTSVPPARARPQCRAGRGWLQMPSSREMGQRMKRPHHQRHCRQCGQTRCPGGLAPKDASPPPNGNASPAASLEKTGQLNNTWFLPASPAQPQPQPRWGKGTLVRTSGQLGAV